MKCFEVASRKWGAVVTGVATGIVALGMSSVARADVSWQHSISIRFPGAEQPIRAVLQTSWSADRNRTRLLVNDPLGTIGAEPGAHGGTEVIRLDNDTLLTWTTMHKTVFQTAYSAWLKRVPFDPWSKGPTRDAQLAAETPPQLTPEQRRRLGREIRASLRPFTRQAYKMYFRALPNAQTIEGIEGHGYRLTTLINVGSPKSPQWGRIACEWWLANDLPGDATIRAFSQHARDMNATKGEPTTSMWLNEMLPVWAETLPDEVQAAAATLSPPAGSGREGFAGTPLRFDLSAYMPTQALLTAPGEDSAVRFQLDLKSRSTSPIPDRVFAAPSDYKIQAVSPESLRQSAKKYKPGMWPSHLSPFASLNSLLGSGASWSAWRILEREAQRQLPFYGVQTDTSNK